MGRNGWGSSDVNLIYYHDNSADKSDDNVYGLEYHGDDGGDRHRHHADDGDYGR